MEGHSILRSSALLALTKLMALDPALCDQNLQLVFTLLQNKCAFSLCPGRQQGVGETQQITTLEVFRRVEEGRAPSRVSKFEQPSMWAVRAAKSVAEALPAEADARLPCSRMVEPCIRSNLVIAVGDLAFRFPNLLEPWTHNMYRPLSDPDRSEPALLSRCRTADVLACAPAWPAVCCSPALETPSMPERGIQSWTRGGLLSFL